MKGLQSNSVALIAIFHFSFASMSLSQELRLFEETESSSNDIDNRRSQAVRRDDDGNPITGPEFTLIGTTRIGASSLVVFKDRVGEIISVTMTKGASREIPSYPGFYVVSAGAGKASIKYPAGLPCTEFRTQGVICETADTAVLNLANVDPLPSLSNSHNDRLVDIQESGESNAVNPFEALLERAANPDSAGDTNAFKPVRINPQDVPPGMRIVSTPFGDRLVEED